MSMNMSVFKRFMAVLLVLTLIVGYMPASTLAADDSATGSEPSANTTAQVVTDFTVAISRSEHQEPVPTEPEVTEAPEVDEPVEDEVATVAEEEEAEPSFNYEVSLMVGGEDVSDKADFQWTTGDAKVNGAQVEEITGETEITLKTVYDGIALTHTFKAADFDKSNVKDEGDKKVMEVSLTAGLAKGTLVRGTKVNAPLPTGNFTLTSGKWSTVWNSELVESGLVIGATTGSAKVAALTMTGASGTEYLTLDWNASISKVGYQTEILANNSAEIKEWYNGDVVVTVKITADVAVSSFDYIAAEVDGYAVTWTSQDGKVWTSSDIVVEKTSTIQSGSKTAKINIDTVQPTVQVNEAYKTKNDQGKKVTVVKFDYTVGESGVRAIFINGENYNPKGDGEQTATISGWDATPEVVVTANNGLTSGKGSAANVQDELSIDFAEPENLGELKGITYLSKEQAKNYLTVTLRGADNKAYKLVSSEVKAVDNDGKDIGGELKYDNGLWIFKVSLKNGLKSLSVSAVDAKGRTCEATLDARFAVDAEAPVVKVSVEKPTVTVDGTSYYNDKVTYTFTATDIMLADDNKVIYTVNGKKQEASFTEDGEAKFSLSDGDKLTNVRVIVKDFAGNETQVVKAGKSNWDADHDCSVIVDTKRPTVSAKISKNVLSFYSNDGMVFAVLEDTNDEKTQEVVLTVSASDANMDDATETFVIEIPAHESGVLEYTFSFQDRAGWNANADVVLTAADSKGDQLGTAVILKADEDGVYTGKIYVDRRAPSSVINGAPTIELKSDLTPTKTADDLDLFNGSFSYEMVITDNSEAGFDTGIKSVTAALNDGLNNSFLTLSQSNQADVYTLHVNAEGEQEIESAFMTIITEDNVGNQFTYAKSFAVDTKAPEIDYSFDQNDATNYYNTDRILTVTVTDTHLADAQVLINGEAQEPVSSNDQSATFVCTIDADGTYLVKITAKDRAGNTDEQESEEFVVDQSAPIIKVEKNGTLIRSEDGVDYYKGDLAYVVTITDQYLSADTSLGYANAANLYYTFEDGTVKTVTLGEWTRTQNKDGSVNYSHKIAVTDGKVLTGITVDASDDSGNKAVLHENTEDFVPAMADGAAIPGAFTYTRTAVADKSAPVVTVTKTVENEGKFVQEFEGVDYYNQTVTYHVTVVDSFLDTCRVTAVYSDGTREDLKNIYKPAQAAKTLAEQEICEYEFSVDGSKVLVDIEIEAMDMSGNAASKPNVQDAARTDFAMEEGVWHYTGKSVVTDVAAPTATIAFSENVEAFYTNGEKIYVVLKEPARGFFGLLNRKEEVTVTITVEDKNIASGNGVLTGNDFKWSGRTSVNETSVLTYVATSGKVDSDSTAVVNVNVSIADLAGNVLTAENLTGDQRVPVVDVDENGAINFNTHVDFRRPTSGNDAENPFISLTPSIKPNKTADGLDLFNDHFSFALKITDDSSINVFNTGVKYVKWSITDPKGVVKSYDSGEKYEADGNYEINVDLAVAEGETNEVTLNIEAVDNVGNTIYYTQTFGVDNLSPRISYAGEIAAVASDLEDSVMAYFDEAVNMYIIVEDLNLDSSFGKTAGYYAEQVKFNDKLEVESSKACESKPLENGRRGLHYDKAGIYGITTYAKDLAQNTRTAEAKDNLFILDLVPPQITVTSTPAEGASLIKSENGVDYYNGEVTYEIVVSDKNLKTADLTYTFEGGSKSEISLDDNDWTVDGTDYSHKFTVTNGQALTNITVDAEDKVQNTADYTYGGIVVVDQSAPVVNVVKSVLDEGKYIQAYKGVDYYNQKVQYDFSVEDNFLSTCEIIAVFTDSEGKESTETVIKKNPSDKIGNLAAVETCTGSFVVEGDKVLTDIQINVWDHSGNAASEIKVTEDNKVTTFTQKDGVWYYAGNDVVVDTIAPTATIAFSENVKEFYVNDGKIFVVLNEPARGLSGLLNREPENVTVTITVNDKNLAIDNSNAHGVKTGNNYGWNGNTPVNADTTLTYVADSGKINADGTMVFEVDVNITDLAGNVLVDLANENSYGYDLPEAVKVDEKGTINFKTYVDFRRPTSGNGKDTPVISLDPSIKPSQTAAIYGIKENEARDLFNNPFQFAMHINDDSSIDVFNTGVKYVKWTVTDPMGVINSYESGEMFDENGNYTICIDMAGGFTAGETNEVTLEIEAVDNVGNTIYYTQTFGVDNLKPRIEYIYTDEGDGRSSGAFYNEDVAVHVALQDLNLPRDMADTRYSIVSNQYPEIPTVASIAAANEKQGLDVTATKLGMENAAIVEQLGGQILLNTAYLYDVDGVYALTTQVEDLAGNANEKNALDANEDTLENIFIVDKTAPVINVHKEIEEGATLVRSDDNVDYYNGEVTYTVTIMDEFLNADVVEGFCNQAKLVYTFENGDEYTVNLIDNEEITEDWNVAQFMDGNTYFVHEFTVTDGQVLTGITVEAVDNASNTAVLSDWTQEFTATEDEDQDGVNEVNGAYTYTRMAVVDKTAPVITVEKTIAENGKYVQTFAKDGVDADYYDQVITYNVTVEDQFLNTGLGTCDLTAVYNDGTTEALKVLSVPAETDILAEADVYEFELVVDGSKVLTDIVFNVKDNSDNVAVEPIVENADRTGFTNVDDIWHYNGNPIVVDTTDPTAEITFSDNVVSFFTNNGIVYAILKKPVKADSGVATSGTETVTMTVVVKDQNLTLDESNKYGIKLNTEAGAWSGETPLNADTVVTYQVSTTVGADGRATIPIELEIADLAGRWLTAENLKQPNLKGITPNIKVVDAVEGETGGKLDFNLTVDRRRASSENDNMAPTITIKPVGIVPTTTAGSEALDLFAKNFKFALTVTDGEDGINEYNSGVQSITWKITDANGVANAYVKNLTNANTRDYDIGGNYDIPVEFKKVGESNVVTLNIEAVDNVGNTIYFEKVFGMDNLAPRVTITQSNHSVQNEKYFKDDQIVNVTIEDLNFEPTTSSVTTEVKFNGWRNVGGNKYNTVLTYNTDGDYTFEMATTDRANNEAVIDYVTGLTSLQNFTIDKTAPIINVTYNPAVAVDTDGAGVQYFDMFRTVTVTINEHNFRASDVQANLGAKNALGAWRDNGDIHTAGDTFFEGNNYSVTVGYTDLAGNPAQSYTSPNFSVDVTEPTIEITNGTMVTNKLNIVPDDLVLGFTINDAQSNMKEVGVEVWFTDSKFSQKRVDGAEIYTVRDANDRTTCYVDFTNIEKVKDRDGIYTVRLTAVDYAGHVVTLPSDLVFSLNRHGSTFFVGDSYTENFLTANNDGIVYQKEVAQKLVVKEINPNAVWQDGTHAEEGSKITVSVNGTAKELKKNVDYTVVSQLKGNGNTKWYEYTYSINPDVFVKDGEQADGKYTIFFYSEDEAANKNSNESNEGSLLIQGVEETYSGKVEFVLDNKAPVINILGLDKTTIIKPNKLVQINITDNVPTTIEVYIDNVLVDTVEIREGQPISSDWIFYDEAGDRYMLNMSAKADRQTLRVVAIDAAGNEFEQVIEGIMLNSSLFRQYINSTPAILISIFIVFALGLGIYVLVNKRKKKEEEDAQN